MKKCELCNSTARMYCESDQAILCWDCDTRVHGANFLVAKHLRTLLCHSCQSPTPWTASGPKLGPTVSICQSCAAHGSVDRSISHALHHDDDDDDDGDDGNDEDDEDDNEGSDDDDDGGGSDEGDGDNQVVPLVGTKSSSSPPPPPLSSSSSSSSEDSSTKRSSRRRSHSNSIFGVFY